MMLRIGSEQSKSDVEMCMAEDPATPDSIGIMTPDPDPQRKATIETSA